MIPKSGHRFSEKIMLKQQAKAKGRFNLKPFRFRTSSDAEYPRLTPMNPTRGIALKLVSALLFAVMSALVRYLGARYPIGKWCFIARHSRSYRSLLSMLGAVSLQRWCAPIARSGKRVGAC